MNYSVSTLAFPGIPISEVIRICREIGLDGIDVRTDFDGEHLSPDSSKQERQQLRSEFQNAGLVLSGIYGYGGRAPMLNPDPQIRAKDIELIKRLVDLAVDLHSPLVRVMNGTKDCLPEHYQRYIESIRIAGEYAQSAGVQLGIETHGELIYDAATAKHIIHSVGLPNVVIIWDPANLIRTGNDALSEAPLMYPLAGYVQLKDWRTPGIVPGREHEACLMGEGEVNLPGLINFLQKQGYNGWLCIEYEKKWHPYMPDPRSGVAHDLQYLKAAFGG